MAAGSRGQGRATGHPPGPGSGDGFRPEQHRPMHHPPGRWIVWRRPVHGPAVVPDHQVTDLPVVVIDILWTSRVGSQLLHESATLSFGHAQDVIDSHSDDDRLTS